MLTLRVARPLGCRPLGCPPLGRSLTGSVTLNVARPLVVRLFGRRLTCSVADLVFLSPLNRLDAGLLGHALSWSSVCFVTRSLDPTHAWRPAFLVSRFRGARLCDPSVSRSCVCLATVFLFTRPARFSLNGHLYAGHAFFGRSRVLPPHPACLFTRLLACSSACRVTCLPVTRLLGRLFSWSGVD